MQQIRDNGDGTQRILTQSEANREDASIAFEEALVATGSPITAMAWIPAALIGALKIWSLSNSSLLGTIIALVSIPCTVVIGVMLKKVLGPLSGVAGLIVAYQIFANFG